MDYRGTIIEESLEDPSILKLVKILKTKVEQVTEKHKTPWLKKWTLHTVEIPEAKADEIAERIGKILDEKHGSSWYADFKNAETHYIIFRSKTFRVNRKSEAEYRATKEYGISLGIPEYQVDFSSEVVVE